MARINVSVGRQRNTGNIAPHERGYVRSVVGQMLQIRNNLVNVIDAIDTATPQALIFGMQPIFDESQRLVPVRTGGLKASGFLVANRRSGGPGGRADIGYAKAGDPFYAVLQHERLDFAHRAPTQAKFLEEAVNRHINEVQPRVAAFIKRTTGIS